jgi:putative peptidoglycan binding protein
MASDPGNSDGNKPAGGGNPSAPKPAAPGQSGAATGGTPAGGAHPVRGPFLIISPSSLPQPQNPQSQPKPPQPAQASPVPSPAPASAPVPSAAPEPTFEDEPTLLADEDPEMQAEVPPEGPETGGPETGEPAAEQPPERLVDIDPPVAAQPSPPAPQAAAQPERPATQRPPQTPLSAGVTDRLAALNNPPPRRGWSGCLTVLIVIAILAGGGYFLWRAGKLDPVLAWAKPYTDPVMEKIQPLIDKVGALIPGHQAAPSAAPDEAMIIETKQLLQKLDFNPGPIDGTLDPATVAAIQAYQEMAGEYVDGQPSEALLEELRAVANPKSN